MQAKDIHPGQYAKIGSWHKKVVNIVQGEASDDLIITAYDDIYERVTRKYNVKTWQEIDVRNQPPQH